MFKIMQRYNIKIKIADTFLINDSTLRYKV